MGSAALLLALVVAGSSGGPQATLADFTGGRVCTRTRWCWEARKPQGLNVHGLWGTASNDVWAVADRGTILHYDGKAWSGVAGVVDADLLALSGSGKTDLWAVGGRGNILHFDGKRWRTVGPATEDWLLGVRAFSAKDVWVAGRQTVHHWDGTRWSSHDLPTRGTALGVFGTGKGDLWFGASKGQALHWNGTEVVEVPGSLPVGCKWLDFSGKRPWALDLDGKLWERSETGAWSPASTPSPFERVWRRRADDAWGFSKTGAVWRFDGRAWSLGKPPLGFGPPLAVWGTGKADVWLAGLSGDLRHWNGTEWQAEPPDPCPSPRGMTSAGGALWLSGPSGLCQRTAEGTTVHKEPCGEPITAVETPDGVWFAAGSLLRWDGQGVKNVNQAMPAAMEHQRFFGIWASGTGEIWAVGEGGVTARFDGKHWLAIPSGTSETLRGIWGSSPTNLWAAGDQGVLHWDGASWTRVEVPPMGKPGSYLLASDKVLEVPESPRSQVYGLWGASPTDLWAVGGPQAKRAIVGYVSLPGKPMRMPSPTPIDWGTALLHWDGQMWSPVATGDVTQLSSIWGSSADDLWAAGDTAILHFDGKTWSREDVGLGLQVRSIAGLGRGDVFVLTDRGYVLHRSP
ncbi:MAG: hypothetical protein QM765_32285 [Myxococcales bacterium]